MTAMSYGMTVGTWRWTKSYANNGLWDNSRYMVLDCWTKSHDSNELRDDSRYMTVD